MRTFDFQLPRTPCALPAFSFIGRSKMLLLCILLLTQLTTTSSWSAGNGKFTWLSPEEAGKCSLHGSYVFLTRQCECDVGWGHSTDVSLHKSPRCDVRICPSGSTLGTSVPASTTVAHALRECSGSGLCNRETGACVCFDGFAGRACERLKCPNDCSGRGRCLNAKQMAKDPAAFPLSNTAHSYGENIATIETTTWDANRTHGCVCDSYNWNVGLGLGER